ncbi:MAG: hypothetical protein M8364_16225 [Methylobacter sp.]|uniref:nucleoside recognition domain-containing protein n=1 Tax=Methylobacter sp. TaxID=2051955 RepID=UPI00258D8C7C|nr:nucleoside recognition domain-containing protein [Methylobacter sp.]MCL7422437.1 hypothetical protein [Methylobacter sp.]
MALFTGVLHKVVVISTLKTIYAQAAQPEAAKPAFDLGDAVKRAFMTIPIGLKKMFGTGPQSQAAGQDPFVAALHAYFHGPIGAFAYTLFILLYFPCIATSAAAYRESSLGWSAFMVAWSTGLAYLTATLFYQLATFSEHPETSTAWLAGIAMIAVAVVLVFRYWGDLNKRRSG